MLKKRDESKKLFLDALSEKRAFDLKSRDEEEFKDKIIKIIERSKCRIKQLSKLKEQEERDDKLKRAELMSCD